MSKIHSYWKFQLFAFKEIRYFDIYIYINIRSINSILRTFNRLRMLEVYTIIDIL